MPARKRIASGLAIAGTLALTACFGAQTPLIPAGEAILPLDREITVCPEDEASCFTMAALDDGYVTPSDMPPGDRGTARFAPLLASGGVQYFILEAKPDGELEVIHLIARRAAGTSPGPATIDIAPADCDDLQGEARAAFEAAGGEISHGFVSNCRAPDHDTLRSALVSVYGDVLADDNWWLAQSR